MLINTNLRLSDKDASVALGFFDGLHIGHQSVISNCVNASCNSLIPTVFTFSYDSNIKKLETSKERLCTKEERYALFEKLGIQTVYDMHFPTIKKLLPEDFVEIVLCKVLRAKKVFCGFNYHFGKGGLATAEDLKRICKKYNIDVFISEPIKYAGGYISSTRIKQAIKQGDMKAVKAMLGRFYGLKAKVIHGRKLGRTLGFPTINQTFHESSVIPRYGVYASNTIINGKCFYSVTNVGLRPTVTSDRVLMETWIPDYTGQELYGRDIEVKLIEFIRDEKKFSTLEELKSSVEKDGKVAKELCDTLAHSIPK